MVMWSTTRHPPVRHTRFAVLSLEGFCPECGRSLGNARGTTVGAVAGDCPEHGAIDDALTA